MAAGCAHLDTVEAVQPSRTGCEDCLRIGSQWVNLRLCMRCGYVGCCDSSPNRHATAHWQEHADHPLVRSFEPGEDWWWCYPGSKERTRGWSACSCQWAVACRLGELSQHPT